MGASWWSGGSFWSRQFEHHQLCRCQRFNGGHRDDLFRIWPGLGVGNMVSRTVLSRIYGHTYNGWSLRFLEDQ